GARGPRTVLDPIEVRELTAMPSDTVVHRTGDQPPRQAGAPIAPCLLVLFGALGDLTKRLLMPALYNLACDGLLPERFAIVGVARDELTTETFRSRMER